ncbi:MAG TPA: phosphoketolase family protein [Methylomirabilota bacterium]|jgi:xylulose-5-phosphate/fructose-6-phosphate phosphoketolase|nr:phosphoketolase family protein [Methylomirabilota bacterium]
MPTAISKERMDGLHAYWRAANYLSAGQIYLRANPLLREPLQPSHIKPRLLGHWGTAPGLNLIYAHLNRLIQDTDANMLLVVGPGHGGPAVRANVFLEGVMSEVYPELGLDLQGLERFMRDFSWPGGVPSHVSPPTPGSIHEGGELGYALVHAYGAAFDNPDLIVVCVVGDGEAETGPLAASWHSNRFLNPARDGAVLPILHLNGYKIAGPTIFGRMSGEQVRRYFEGCGYQVRFVEGDDPGRVHAALWGALDWAHGVIHRIQDIGRRHGVSGPAEWPLIVLRTPKGWTGPKVVDGRVVEGTFRSHQVPITEVTENPEHLRLLETWLKSYRPDELFGASGRPSAAVLALVPRSERRMGASPHANGGLLLTPLEQPDYTRYAVPVPHPGATRAEATRELSKYLRDILRLNESARNFRLFCPDETSSNRLDHVFQATGRTYLGPVLPTDEALAADGRVMEVLSEHMCQGWLEGYLLTGRHGLFPSYEAFALIVDSMVNQHAKWLASSEEIPWRKPVASLNYLLTSYAWRQDHNGFSHQGPGFIETILEKRSSVARIYLPPDANCLLSVMDHCLRSKGYVNLVIAGKQPMPQWLDIDAARAHCARGASVWQWAGNDGGGPPDVVLAAAGDIPTQEVLAATWLLRRGMPELRVRVVNVVDLLSLMPRGDHAHGLDDTAFAALFTEAAPVVFAFHGHPRVIHELAYRRPDSPRFHVRGYIEQGTTTTPFDMVVCNKMSRYHLAIEALRRTSLAAPRVAGLIAEFEKALEEHAKYIREHGQDMPEVRDWRWSD